LSRMTAGRGRLTVLIGVLVAVVMASNAHAGSKTFVTHRRVVSYNGFSNASTYAQNWLLFYSLELQFGAKNLPAFSHGKLRLAADPFRGWMDKTCVVGFPVCVNADHVKYQAFSRRTFSVPKHGSVALSADILARTSGTRLGYVVRATGRRIPEAQQAAAVLQMTEPNVAMTLDWFVSRHEAMPKIERTLAPVGTAGLDRAYTQFLPAVGIKPGRPHRFSIRYTRGLRKRDLAEWFIDGQRVAAVHDVGIPLDVQNPRRYGGITFRSLGRGERLAPKMNNIVIGHGVYSFVDNFPFFPAYSLFPTYPTFFVSIPEQQRIFGQGVDATFSNFKVATVSNVGLAQ
ncbi:MAG TPA: DUF6081 family protein, partial [Solirubrobacteraceae bacterium]|nr:DUF6081 family protein [Solirubrobacteraceae bacterium]